MYLLLTDSKRLNGWYEDSSKNGLTYFGYTDDEHIAEKYAKQFKMNDGQVFYVETTMEFIKTVNKELERDLCELSEIGDEKKSIVLTDAEIEYMEEVYSECSDTLDDLKYGIEILEMFNNPKVKRLKKDLKRLFRVLNDPQTTEEEEEAEDIYADIDITKRYILLASRLRLFDYNYSSLTK